MNKTATLMLLMLVALPAAQPLHAQDQARLKIVYMGFADTVELDGERLNYSFVYSSAPRAAVLDLAAEQKQLFVDWLDRCRVFSLAGPDVLVAEPNHPGAEERNSLQVEFGDKKIELFWRGVSRWNDRAQQELLERAVDELTKLSLRLVRESGLL